jgi:hypothetical protein
MLQQFGGTSRIHSEKTSVLYDKDSGRIHHVHHTVTLEGGQESSEKEIETQMLEVMRNRGKGTQNLHVIHVGRDAMKPDHLYRVDPKSRSLVVTKKLTPSPDVKR